MQEWYKKTILIFFFLFLIVLSSFCFAAPPVTQVQQFTVGYVIEAPVQNFLIINYDYKFNIHVYNISNGLPILNQSTSCTFHLYNNSGNHIDKQTTTLIYDDYDFEFLVKGGNFSHVGEYRFVIFCNSSTLGGFIEQSFLATSDGLDNTNLTKTTKLNVYAFLICVGMCLILLILGFVIKEYAFVAVGSMFMVMLGLYMYMNGLQGVNTIIVQTLTLVLLALGLYIFIKGSLDKLNE